MFLHIFFIFSDIVVPDKNVGDRESDVERRVVQRGRARRAPPARRTALYRGKH